MISTPFLSSTLSLLNSSNKPPISSFHLHPLLKFNNAHVKIAQISIRPTTITTKASAAAAAAAAAANGSYIPATDKETLYDLLGISETETISEIKKAHKQMALKYHPDVSPPDRAEEYTVRFIQELGLTRDPMISGGGTVEGDVGRADIGADAAEQAESGSGSRDVVGIPDPEATEQIMR
ncbi:DnaJ domain-containing protein [Cynara cardunculus var. scolymus]|uniref:DnaJ domain-containing protein n=1 Tax=Cynara cardunculus var. scolymus TaxID=59895 RepID=A0A103YNC1_CYNCS|nr:DnaJ domain-containing protein [Cynara cardunculus var. scolymus]